MSGSASPAVMLADRSGLSAEATLEQLTTRGAGEWWAELKWDGVRAVVTRDADGIRITNRTGRDITARYPDVVANQVEDWHATLDGEIVSLDASGRPDFERIAHRNGLSGPAAIARTAARYPAIFIPFDILTEQGRDLRSLSYRARREHLAAVWPWQLPAASRDLDLMWGFVVTQGLEGLVLKRGDAPYRAGRQPSWLKLPRRHRVSVIAGELMPGASAGGPGSVEMLVRATRSARSARSARGRLQVLGQVSSGLRAADYERLRSRSGERVVELVMEVEFLNRTSEGRLRQPVFKGWRDDLDARDCTLAQFEGI